MHIHVIFCYEDKNLCELMQEIGDKILIEEVEGGFSQG